MWSTGFSKIKRRENNSMIIVNNWIKKVLELRAKRRKWKVSKIKLADLRGLWVDCEDRNNFMRISYQKRIISWKGWQGSSSPPQRRARRLRRRGRNIWNNLMKWKGNLKAVWLIIKIRKSLKKNWILLPIS